MKIGKTKKRNECRFCGSDRLFLFLDMGYMPHAGEYLTGENVGKELSYPLKLYFCERCHLVQILDIISPKKLFTDYRYMSSISLKEHFDKYASEVSKRFFKPNSLVVEIGSNDGVLLAPLSKFKINAIGIDPAKNISQIATGKGLKVITSFFSAKVVDKIVKENGRADGVLANNVLAHIDNMDDVFKNISKLLKPTGVLIFEVHYFPDLLKKMQYDFFYNEHLSYYHLETLVKFLKKYKMQIFDIRKTKIHSGSIRIYAKFKNNNLLIVNKRVLNVLDNEKKLRLVTKKNLRIFATKVYKHKEKFVKFLNSLSKNNKIVGYGASGRANTFLNFCGIDSNQIDFIVDDSPERQGRFTPKSHIPIVSREIFLKSNIKNTILLAWNYKKSIIKKESKYIKKGGKFIVPFPRIYTI